MDNLSSRIQINVDHSARIQNFAYVRIAVQLRTLASLYDLVAIQVNQANPWARN